jgi:hypothetical protein
MIPKPESDQNGDRFFGGIERKCELIGFIERAMSARQELAIVSSGRSILSGRDKLQCGRDRAGGLVPGRQPVRKRRVATPKCIQVSQKRVADHWKVFLSMIGDLSHVSCPDRQGLLLECVEPILLLYRKERLEN